MKKFDIVGLFPIPVLHANIGRGLTSKELQCVEKFRGNVKENMGNNFASVDTNVLEDHDLIDIKNFIYEAIDQYKKEILSPKNAFNLKVTQSWLNWTDADQEHHFHSHANSYISGVFYVDAVQNLDRIIFEKNTESNYMTNCNFDYQVESWNIFNSPRWWLPASTGDILLFPSNLRHGVPPENQRDASRISLAFNTWFTSKTVLGSEVDSTLLEI